MSQKTVEDPKYQMTAPLQGLGQLISKHFHLKTLIITQINKQTTKNIFEINGRHEILNAKMQPCESTIKHLNSFSSTQLYL